MLSALINSFYPMLTSWAFPWAHVHVFEDNLHAFAVTHFIIRPSSFLMRLLVIYFILNLDYFNHLYSSYFGSGFIINLFSPVLTWICDVSNHCFQSSGLKLCNLIRVLLLVHHSSYFYFKFHLAFHLALLKIQWTHFQGFPIYFIIMHFQTLHFRSHAPSSLLQTLFNYSPL